MREVDGCRLAFSFVLAMASARLGWADGEPRRAEDVA